MTRVAVLTPPGTGAIATVEVAGPRAWEFARQLFRPVGKPLPTSAELHRIWFGTLGEGVGDEVILAVAGADTIEVHCHGGQQVVRWVVEHFLNLGCVEGVAVRSESLLALLQHAPTLRTASILLDQVHGAFNAALSGILESPNLAGLAELARFAAVGRHLVKPWKVVIAGPPNVGKSSLVNALAGYQRAVVSEVAGTTRDVLSVPLAFNGWPVELTDTAGLRDAEGLEGEGIERAKQVLAEADLVVWVMDATALRPQFPDRESESVADLPQFNWLLAINKIDCPAAWDFADAPNASRVAAATGEGIPELIARIASHLVPNEPSPEAAVPYSHRWADVVEAAQSAANAGQCEEATRLLRDCRARD